MGLCNPALPTAEVTAETDVCGARTSHELPPLKSMPRLKPRIARDPSPIKMMMIEMVNQVRLRPTKSIVVRPW
jgi:hypothetical protein